MPFFHLAPRRAAEAPSLPSSSAPQGAEFCGRPVCGQDGDRRLQLSRANPQPITVLASGEIDGNGQGGQGCMNRYLSTRGSRQVRDNPVHSTAAKFWKLTGEVSKWKACSNQHT